MRPGLAPDGTIAREGALSKVPAAYARLLDETRDRIRAAFPGGRLHSAYVYGSIPRGTARAGRSDLDLLVAVTSPPTAADRATADRVEAGLDADFDVIDGVGLLLYDTDTLLSELERYDLGFFVACLCTPLLGPDLAGALPRYRPDGLLARETNGDIGLALPGWLARAAAARTDGERAALCRGVARRVVRTGFTLVMPRWGGWTSSLDLQAQVFSTYHPSRGAAMSQAARWARTPVASPEALHLLLTDLTPWLASTYLTTWGPKTPRPGAQA
ncbi:nucleotidyltransferase domain-containing protein [Actinacidiphila bryophytorum]|uniref:Nucleotidyltransferase domain-containing protein n=1 Tax=Actinacidiphila bryophytorum TaxID=1436133 RepID=A0A9W4E2H3_9ACTN|nr:nucleotidyltransferase domain-containing protein [Actinacidiphila bryophytorum]MBM9439759.1 nucleotidyltransferase domain-containing protein [Actinacidiphila bryophytorum]MBN6546298.1 nucleotidyltransferase domain-containing protein [Actinacidiphila bryophytorum]CAG7605446.1 Nucleotidyltransferase domain-containing protein [Actinacidiphila bryophytorum]